MHINKKVSPTHSFDSQQVKRSPQPTSDKEGSEEQVLTKASKQVQPASAKTVSDLPTVSNEDLEEIKTKIEQGEVDDSDDPPKPQTLQEQLQAKARDLTHVETDDRSGLSETMKAQFKEDALRDQGLLSRTSLAPLEPLKPLVTAVKTASQEFDQAYIQYAQGGEPLEFLTQNLTQSLKSLDKAGKHLFGKSKIKKSVNHTQSEVQRLIGDLSAQIDLSVFLKAQSEAQLRALVTQAVGELKGYSPEQIASLSKKKQAFVEAVVKGIQTGLKAQETMGNNAQGGFASGDDIGALARALDKMETALETQMQDYEVDGNMVRTLGLKSRSELVAEFKGEMGHKSALIFETMLNTIDRSLQAKDGQLQIGSQRFYQEASLAELLEPLALKDKFGSTEKAQLQALIRDYAPDSDMIWTLTLKSQTELHQMLKQVLGSQFADKYLNAMVETINESLPNQFSQTKTQVMGKGGMLNVPQTLTMDGKTYGTPTFLAEGAFGNVFSYVNLADPDDKVVVKEAIVKETQDPEMIRQETVSEVIAHREIQGQGHPNIIGLEGVVKSPDQDQLFIVMEHASGGNLFSASNKLKAHVKSGLISEDTRHLLGTFFLKNTLQGLVHMQETRQAHHGDFKSPNILIGSDGLAKLTDFGTSGFGHTVGKTSRGIDNPSWLSPEYISHDWNYGSNLAQQTVYHELYQTHQELIESAFEAIDDPDLQQRIEKAKLKYITQFAKLMHQDKIDTLEAEIEGEDLSHFNARTDREAKNMRIGQLLEERYPEQMAPVKERALIYILNATYENFDDTVDLDREALEKIYQIGNDLFGNTPQPRSQAYFDRRNQIEQENLVQADVAHLDTWGAGIVALELLVTPLNFDEIDNPDETYSDKAQRDDYQHYGKINFNSTEMYRLEENLKAFAQQDRRMMETATDLKMAKLVELYQEDERLENPDYSDMLEILTGPEPPFPPGENATEEALNAYQEKRAAFKTKHDLDDEALEMLQSNFSQAVLAFKTVLQTDFGMGATAQDRLINGLTHPDPQQRMKASAALENSIFQDPRLDAPELPLLWQALNAQNPDPEQIKQLVEQMGI